MMVRVSPGSPSQWKATLSPLPAATWRSRQLYETFSVPPTNHLANGRSHSSTVSHRFDQSSASACRAQNASTVGRSPRRAASGRRRWPGRRSPRAAGRSGPRRGGPRSGSAPTRPLRSCVPLGSAAADTRSARRRRRHAARGAASAPDVASLAVDDDECIHGLQPATCSLCRAKAAPKPPRPAPSSRPSSSRPAITRPSSTRPAHVPADHQGGPVHLAGRKEYFGAGQRGVWWIDQTGRADEEWAEGVVTAVRPLVGIGAGVGPQRR